MANRRQFLKGLSMCMAAQPIMSMARNKAGKRLSLWVGSCSMRGAKNGIFHSWFDPATGTLSEPVLAAETQQPSFFTTMKDARGRQVLYTVNELDADKSTVTAFAIDETAGTLTQINSAASVIGGPTYISARPSTHTLYTANYTGSGLSVFHARPDGALDPVIQHIDTRDTARFGTPGPHVRQGISHPHSTQLSPDGKFVIVNDLGDDSIDIFAVAPDGRLSDAGPTLVKVPPQTGPRHVAFHPNGKWVYGIDELDNTLRLYAWEEKGSAATLRYLDESILTTAPGTPAPAAGRPWTASEVAISPDGRFLYACTRGDDSLTVFAIDAKTGKLNFKQRIGTGGRTPRFFGLDPTANWIICCNNNSPAVTLFKRNPADGSLSGPVQTLAIESPEYALFT